jgi:hypothetical protein
MLVPLIIMILAPMLKLLNQRGVSIAAVDHSRVGPIAVIETV